MSPTQAVQGLEATHTLEKESLTLACGLLLGVREDYWLLKRPSLRGFLRGGCCGSGDYAGVPSLCLSNIRLAVRARASGFVFSVIS